MSLVKLGERCRWTTVKQSEMSCLSSLVPPSLAGQSAWLARFDVSPPPPPGSSREPARACLDHRWPPRAIISPVLKGSTGRAGQPATTAPLDGKRPALPRVVWPLSSTPTSTKSSFAAAHICRRRAAPVHSNDLCGPVMTVFTASTAAAAINIQI